MAASECGDDMLLDGDGASRHIDEEGALAHQGELAGGDHAGGLGRERAGEDDIVASLQELIKRLGLDALRKAGIAPRMRGADLRGSLVLSVYWAICGPSACWRREWPCRRFSLDFLNPVGISLDNPL